MTMTMTLKDLGWSPFFQRQMTGELSDLTPFRISSIHRDRLTALGHAGEVTLTTPPGLTTADIAVGDWVLADDRHRIVTLLERQTELSRRAAGTDATVQLIAANVDTLLIISSCNPDFNIARLERYVALAHDTGALPVIVLTKSDMTDDPDTYLRQAEALAPMQIALTINALDPDDLARISGWIGAGQTAALVGSSGVGKTTILNGLSGRADETQSIREDDAHGRHTTTVRALIPLTDGGWIIDTPGMRALRLHDADDGIEKLFADIVDLTGACRFSDCSHTVEPGCAVTAAIDAGLLDPDRVTRWQKLRAETRRNSETIAQSRARGRDFSKMVRTVTRDKSRRKGD